jgi:hypothetical protein
MERTIHIDNKDVKFKATGATVRIYREHFGRDFFADFQQLQADTEKGGALQVDTLLIFENIAHTMAKQADPEVPDDPDEWLDQFEMFSIYIALPQLIELWNLSSLPTAQSKKKE